MARLTIEVYSRRQEEREAPQVDEVSLVKEKV
jgi:hypothetical protein